MKKIKVKYFQRKPQKGFSFSLEFIFNDVRNRLLNQVDPEVLISTWYNNGIYTKIGNIVEAAFRQGDSINHITGETHFLNFFMKKSTVILTILDCGPMVRKDGIAKDFVKWLYLKLPIYKSAVVTTISEAVKEEIIAYTNCNSEKIRVIPVAINDEFKPFEKTFNSSKPVILQIGTGPNKNVERIIQSLKDIQCQLVIIGKINDSIGKALEENKTEYLNYVGLSQEALIEQYKLCDIVSFISTFEGFGMPIIEANSIERVVVTSNISSMPEVAGNSACLVDPFDINSIKKGFVKVIQNEDYRNKLIMNGRINRTRFNPDIIAQSYFELYKKMKFGS